MTANEYLAGVLAQQNLTDVEVNTLRGLRDQIQGQLSVFEGNPRFYYAGSYGKHTMIRQRYDLDIVVYWPNGVTYTIKGIYDAVGKELQKHWKFVRSKTVSWELPFEGGFHVDIVPGRALDTAFKEANLYRTDTGTTLKTSVKTHIDSVSESGRRDAIRLMKLWRERKAVPFKKSLLLELMTISGCSGKRVDDLSAQVWAALHYVRDNIRRCNVLDPANSNNSLSDV
jgi:tRNA nucleotidyltransferase (CCA-adding enzyme)